MLMSPARKVGLAILSPLFIFLLFATAFDVGFVRTATHPNIVKKLVAESGIYDSVVPNILSQNPQITTSLGTISSSDPTVTKAANTALSPSYIEKSTETAIDSIYAWLDGKTTQPDFKLDLSGAKNDFASNIAASVQQKLSSLPPCTTAQNLAIARSGQYDYFNATCLPRGVGPAAAATQVQTSIAHSQDFLNQPTISANNIGSIGASTACQGVQTCGNSKFFIDHQNIPKQYQRAKKTPIILSILTILCGAGIVLLSSSWQRGLRHVGINLVIIGAIMLVFSWALNRTVSTQVVPKIKIDNALFQKDVRSLVTDLTQQVDKNYWYFGAVYLAVGVSSIAVSEILQRRMGPKNKGAPIAGGATSHTRKSD